MLPARFASTTTHAFDFVVWITQLIAFGCSRLVVRVDLIYTTLRLLFVAVITMFTTRLFVTLVAVVIC